MLRCLSLSLLLWVLVSDRFTTRAQVSAPASLTVLAGRPLLLGCNITTAPGDAVRQVRWLNQSGDVLLAYEQNVPVRISHQEPLVRLAAAHRHRSAITLQGVRHDGCYRCLFDVFPTGTQEGNTCVHVTGEVLMEGNRTAVGGRSITLSCVYGLPERVRQVLWRRRAEQGDSSTVASLTKHRHHSVGEAFRDRVSLGSGLGETRLSIEPVRLEDEACYTCEFHTYPDGSRSATACLSVYVLPKPEVNRVTLSSGVTEVNCTARSRPAAEVFWSVGGDNGTLGPPTSWSYEQGDGITVVTSTLLVQSEELRDRDVKCIVQHPGLEEPVTLTLGSEMAPAKVILLSVCGVVAVLLLGLCVFLCKCLVCSDD